MRIPFFKITTPPCPACGSKNTTTGRKIRLAAGLGIGVGGSFLCLILGFLLYPPGLVLVPIAVICGFVICLIPPLGKYCCLDCDAYWNPDNPKLYWKPREPGI